MNNDDFRGIILGATLTIMVYFYFHNPVIFKVALAVTFINYLFYL
ncbi:MAG: hypothetical protein K0R78_2981 [Pelosinus sp.]|jgi:hypothetical protein|nr:hypothetical protein [Pelosinus sp.]